MAQIKSQIKRNRTNEEANARNVKIKSQLRTAIKKVRLSVEAKNKEEALANLKIALRLIDKSVSSGAQHKNTAARQKSEVQNLVNSLK